MAHFFTYPNSTWDYSLSPPNQDDFVLWLYGLVPPSLTPELEGNLDVGPVVLEGDLSVGIPPPPNLTPELEGNLDVGSVSLEGNLTVTTFTGPRVVRRIVRVYRRN